MIKEFTDDEAVLPDAIQGPYRFDPAADVKSQRYALDFGGQKLVPVYIVGVQNGTATFITFDELQKLERAKSGEQVELTRFEAPFNIIRLATDAQHLDARRAYLDDFEPRAKEIRVKANKERLKGFENQSMLVEKQGNLQESFFNMRAMPPSECSEFDKFG